MGIGGSLFSKKPIGKTYKIRWSLPLANMNIWNIKLNAKSSRFPLSQSKILWHHWRHDKWYNTMDFPFRTGWRMSNEQHRCEESQLAIWLMNKLIGRWQKLRYRQFTDLCSFFPSTFRNLGAKPIFSQSVTWAEWSTKFKVSRILGADGAGPRRRALRTGFSTMQTSRLGVE